MATALTLSLGWPKSLGPWLYPAYYVALLFPRQYFDDQRCAKKVRTAVGFLLLNSPLAHHSVCVLTLGTQLGESIHDNAGTKQSEAAGNVAGGSVNEPSLFARMMFVLATRTDTRKAEPIIVV